MQLQTYLKNIKVSPKKLRFILPEVKKLSPSQALEKLLYANQKSAQVLYKAIKSSISNAVVALKCNPDLLKFKLFTIEQGQKLKRYQAGSRGSAKPVVHRYSHIKIILETEERINAEEKEEIKTNKEKITPAVEKTETNKKSVAVGQPRATKIKNTQIKSKKKQIY